MKKLKLILSIILMSLMIIKILSSCSFAMTIQDFEDFINSGVTWQQNFVGYTNYNVLLQTPQAWINSNAWYDYKQNFDISNYENAIIRSLDYNTYYKRIIVYFFNDNNNTYYINSTGTINTGIGNVGNLIVTNAVPDKRLEFKTTERNNNNIWEFVNYTDSQIDAGSGMSNASNLFMIKQPITNQQNLNYIGYNVFNQIKAYDRSDNTIGKIADIRIGNFYDPYDLSYRLYTQLSGSKRYIPFDYEIIYASGESYDGKLAELKTINIKQLVNSDYCYLEMIDNNGVLITSNKFSIHFDNDTTINNYGNTYNASGDYTGAIDLTGVINAINTESYIIYSGDQQIINEIKYLESGENLRFQYWQNVYNTFFNYSGDYSGILRSGDFLGITINYDDYDNWGFGDFVVDLFQNIIYTVNSNQDTTINFGFLGDINSADFKINNSTINSFVGIFSNGLFLLMIIFFYYRLIKAIASLNIDKLAKYDFDSLFNLF